MYYNIETRKTCSRAIMLAQFNRAKKRNDELAKISFEEYCEAMTIQNGGPYIKISNENTKKKSR